MYNNAGTVPLAASVNFNNVVFNNPAMNTATGSTASGSIPVNNITGMDNNHYAAPRSTQFSLGVQQSIGKSILSLAYVGTQNRHQSFYQQIDLPADWSLYLDTFIAPRRRPIMRWHPTLDITPSPCTNESNGDYNALQASFRGQYLNNGLNLPIRLHLFACQRRQTAGSSNYSAGDLGKLSNPYLGWKYDFGPSTFDHHQVFFVNFVYDLPFFRHSDNKPLKTTHRRVGNFRNRYGRERGATKYWLSWERSATKSQRMRPFQRATTGRTKPARRTTHTR